MAHDAPHDATLSCRDTTWLVSEARDRHLLPAERALLRQHIEGCPHCKVASKQFERLFSQIDTLFGRNTTDF